MPIHPEKNQTPLVILRAECLTPCNPTLLLPAKKYHLKYDLKKKRFMWIKSQTGGLKPSDKTETLSP